MSEPTLKVGDEYKPLHKLSKGETQTLLNTLYQRLDQARLLPNNKVSMQIERMITMTEERLDLYDSGELVPEVKETTARKISILDDDF